MQASSLITSFEADLYDANILCPERKLDSLPLLERLMYELASDPLLTNGLFYSITLVQTCPALGEKSMRKSFALLAQEIIEILVPEFLTRYIESGCYEGFFKTRDIL